MESSDVSESIVALMNIHLAQCIDSRLSFMSRETVVRMKQCCEVGLEYVRIMSMYSGMNDSGLGADNDRIVQDA